MSAPAAAAAAAAARWSAAAAAAASAPGPDAADGGNAANAEGMCTGRPPDPGPSPKQNSDTLLVTHSILTRPISSLTLVKLQKSKSELVTKSNFLSFPHCIHDTVNGLPLKQRLIQLNKFKTQNFRKIKK